MMSAAMQHELTQQIIARTHHRVTDLSIEVSGSLIVLRGRADSFHLKQLAQHGISDMCPDAVLDNRIVVERVA